MHIHLEENPARYAPCESSKNLLYVSTETLAKFSNMDMNMTLEWVRVNKVSVHKCQDETYVTAHSILQFLTEDNDPPMDVDAGLNLLTAKLGHTPRVRPARAGIDHTLTGSPGPSSGTPCTSRAYLMFSPSARSDRHYPRDRRDIPERYANGFLNRLLALRKQGYTPIAVAVSNECEALAPRKQGYTLFCGPEAFPTRVGPLRYSKRINFECTIPLPGRPARQTKASKRKIRVKEPNRDKKPRPTPTPLALQERIQKRREYEKSRNQRPERRQYARDREKERRQKAKELGICKTCSQPAIPGQTRCPPCAEKHRRYNKNITAKR